MQRSDRTSERAVRPGGIEQPRLDRPTRTGKLGRRKGQGCRGAGRNTDIPPLEIWRRRNPADITPEAVVEIRRALAGPILLHHRRWLGATTGDDAAAVAVAIELLRRQGTGTTFADLVMSSLVVHAMAGNAAAAMVLAHGLASLSHGRPDAADLVDRSEQWARYSPAAAPSSRARRADDAG